MATVKKNISKKTGKVISYRWRCCVGRDGNDVQQWITKTVKARGMTPVREMKVMQQEADAWENEQREEYKKAADQNQAQSWRDKENMTLSTFIDEVWIPDHVKRGGKRPHTPDTIAFYMSMGEDIKAYFKEKHPGIKLNQIGLDHVVKYLSYLRYDARTKRGTPYGATTIQHHFSTLRNIMEYARYRKYISANPCKEVREEDRPAREKTDVVFLDEDQAVRFMQALESKQEIDYWKHRGLPESRIAQGDENGNYYADYMRWKCLVNVLITTGLRRGEVVGLRWGDIDKVKGIVSIQRNVTIDTTNKSEADASKKIHIGQTKGKESRVVAISKYVLEQLDIYKAEQQKKYGVLLPSAYVFCRDNDPYIPLYPTEPTRMMAKFIKRHRLPNVSPHDLRHTAGYLAITSGADVKQIQALLGHKDPAVTLQFYIGVTQKGQQKTVEGIEALLRPQTEKTAEE